MSRGDKQVKETEQHSHHPLLKIWTLEYLPRKNRKGLKISLIILYILTCNMTEEYPSFSPSQHGHRHEYASKIQYFFQHQRQTPAGHPFL